MIKSPILWRLYAGYVVVILISTTIVGLLVGRQVTSNEMQELQVSLTVRSEMLAELSRETLMLAETEQKLVKLQRTIEMLGQKSDSRLTVIRADGTVIADSRESPVNMDNHLNRPEIIGAGESGQATTTRFSQTVSQNMSYIAVRVDSTQGMLGFVRVSIPLQDIEQKTTQLWWLILLGAASSSLAALVLGFYFAKRFTDPLRNMTEIAGAISQGDYERRISVSHKDELGTLAAAFNRMARSSAERVLEITTERNRLAKILSSMAEGVIAIDSDRRIIHANHAAVKLLASNSRVSDLQSADLSKDDLAWEDIRVPAIIEAVETAFASGEVVMIQMQQAEIQNDQVVDIHVSPLMDETNTVTGAVLVLNDVSELANLERIRRDFVANASHELKTPITAIRGLTETMLDDPSMDGATRLRFVERISAQSMRLSVLVTDLLAISRLEADQTEQKSDPIDMQELVKRSVSAAIAASNEKQLALVFESNESNTDMKIMTLGDRQSLSQMVDNLLDNAVKYTPAGGRVDVQLTAVAEQICLQVADTGIGIDNLAQQRIFERFYRVDKARSRDLGGTGLGLSIVKNIVEQHGGSVQLESELGAGSTFTVVLPLAT
ncbi:MAG: ATP-binding protein [Pseudomonadales bacterium]|nr:ATP-binding protein [Pseudomonadales bacterium]MDG1443805.1 ATP-binding protein [Pseudomonadales bacterium]